MLTLIRFEIRKLLRSTYSYVMLGILLVFLLGYFIYSHTQTTYLEDRVEQLEEAIYHSQSSSLQELEEELKEDPSLKDSHSFMESYNFYLNYLEELNKELTAVKNKNWAYVYEKELEYNKLQYEEVSNPYFPYKNYSRYPSDFLIIYNQEELLWLKERDIEPVFPLGTISKKTIYDFIYDDPMMEEIHREYSNKHSTSSIFFAYKFFGLLFNVIGVAFFLFFFGDIFTKEQMGAYGPINFLYTQPLARGKIFFSKLLTLFINTALIFLGISLFAILAGLVTKGLGHWDYPVLVYQEERGLLLMPMLGFIARATLLFFAVLLFSYSLLLLFSLLTKRTVLALGFTLGLIVLGINFSGEPASTLSAFNPFQYFDVYKIINLETASTHDNFKLNFTNGLLSLLIASTALLAGSYGLTKTR